MSPSDLPYKEFLIIEINVFVKFSWDSVSFHQFLKVFFKETFISFVISEKNTKEN